MFFSDMQKIGIGLTGFGIVFLFLGIMLFFDTALLAMGNLMFLGGVACIMGPAKTVSFFFQPEASKVKGSVAFFSGVALVLFRWPFFGMIFEVIGLYFLFSGLIPAILAFLRGLPVVGTFFSLPIFNKLLGMSGVRSAV